VNWPGNTSVNKIHLKVKKKLELKYSPCV